jgi:hypothetical protein
MSENSEHMAVPGGNRRKYCLKIGMYITGCILEKTCEQCKGEENAIKRPNKPQNNNKTPSKNPETVRGTGANTDKKRLEKRPNMSGSRQNITPNAIKTQEDMVFSEIRIRKPRTKRALTTSEGTK